MTNCQACRDQLGPYFDGELAHDQHERLRSHLCACADCRAELRAISGLAGDFAQLPCPRVPQDLWAALNRRLTNSAPGRGRFVHFLHAVVRTRLATAAAIVVVCGLLLIGVFSGDRRAAASQIDFTVLLDGLQFDVDDAFAKFVARNNGRRVTAAQLREHAHSLNFATPEELPGGFVLREVYALRVGDNPGVAARYERNGELLAAIFHPPVRREEFGSHKDHPCVVGKHRGHKVSVGEWKLVHVTDPTTCHCVLSRLDEESELPAILKIVAPEIDGAAPAPCPHEQ